MGIHDRCGAQPTQYWLKSNKVTHIRPATGLIKAHCSIAKEKINQIRASLIEEKRFEIEMDVNIFQDERLVAEAKPIIGVYIDDPRFPDILPSRFQTENAKLAAALIAGLRKDKLSQIVAGEQGRTLAERFSNIAPQLPNMIEAREFHLTNFLKNNSQKYEQVLVLGIGLDLKPLSFATAEQIWFGLDLDRSLSDRKRRLAVLKNKISNDHLRLVAADLRLENWTDELLKVGFDFQSSTLVIMEGLSMYFFQEELSRILEKLHETIKSKDKNIWIDHVTPKMFRLDKIEVQSFLSSMSRLGEPFITGFLHPEILNSKWRTISQNSAAEILEKKEMDDPVYHEYKCTILEGN
jgi:methyltransferase (TIGR00027 family)